MQVRYIGKETVAIEYNKPYSVLNIELGWYRIMTELEEDYLFPPKCFEIITSDEEMTTLSYYNKNATAYVTETSVVDFSSAANRFLSYLPPVPSILDFGCGSGRDSKYFLSKGCVVAATDGSEALCKLAEQSLGIPVKCMLFQELSDASAYDGIWACASILHLPKRELQDVFYKMQTALKNEGFLYASFKYGRFEGMRGERFYTDFDEESIREFLADYPRLALKEMWLSSDVRLGRENEKWLNIILQKQAIH